MANGGSNKDAVTGLVRFIKHVDAQATQQEKIDAILADNNITEGTIRERVSRIEQYLGNKIAEYHSRLSSDREALGAKIRAAAESLFGRIAEKSDVARLGLPPQLAAAFFRNLEGLTSKDKKSMSEDLELLEILEKHINNKK